MGPVQRLVDRVSTFRKVLVKVLKCLTSLSTLQIKTFITLVCCSAKLSHLFVVCLGAKDGAVSRQLSEV